MNRLLVIKYKEPEIFTRHNRGSWKSQFERLGNQYYENVSVENVKHR